MVLSSKLLIPRREMSCNRMKEVPGEEAPDGGVPALEEEAADGGVPALNEEAPDGCVPALEEESADSGFLAMQNDASDNSVPALEEIAPDNGDPAVKLGNGSKKETSTLPPGYYMLEAIRKKRMNKGGAEYFIKWDGYPESDNTWEPYEHLSAEVVKAFEQRMQSRQKAKSGQKAKPWQKKRTPTVVVKTDQTTGRVLTPPQVEGGIAQDERTVNDCETSNEVNVGNIDVHKQGVGEAAANGHAREGEDLVQAGPRKASRKRKCYQVTRFRKEETDPRVNPSVNGNSCATDGKDLALQAGPSNASRKGKHVQVTRFCEEETDCRINPSDNRNEDDPAIVEILRPVLSEEGRNGEVIITFAVSRSDGKEAMADNKYMKIHCPQLLISFYESCFVRNADTNKNEGADKEDADKEDADKEDADKEAS